MKLYTLPGACSTADHIALYWSDLPFEVATVARRGAVAAELRLIHPAGTLPVLVDGDFVLSQNAAILGYVADRAPQARLLGDGSARQRAEATRWLMFSNADIQPVFGTFFEPGLFIDDEQRFDALQARARRRLREVAAGRAWLHPQAQRQMLDWMRRPPSGIDALTARERTVLLLLAEGLSNKLIARRLDLTEGTVKGYVSQVLDKLGVSDRTQAALLAHREGLGAPG